MNEDLITILLDIEYLTVLQYLGCTLVSSEEDRLMLIHQLSEPTMEMANAERS
jgi:hypothetical protein